MKFSKWIKFFWTGKCPECGEKLIEDSEWKSDNYSSWNEITISCKCGFKVIKTGKSQEFR